MPELNVHDPDSYEQALAAAINSLPDVNTVDDAEKLAVGNLPVDTANELAGKASTAQGALADSAVQPDSLSAVATSGDYNDLTNTPDLSALNEIEQSPDDASFPGTGSTNIVYIAEDTGYMFRWNGSGYTQLTDQTAIWGQIAGTLSDQADLIAALNAKAASAHTHALADVTPNVYPLSAGHGLISGNAVTSSFTAANATDGSAAMLGVCKMSGDDLSLYSAGSYITLSAAEWQSVIVGGAAPVAGKYYWLSTTNGQFTDTQPSDFVQLGLAFITDTSAIVIAGPMISTGISNKLNKSIAYKTVPGTAYTTTDADNGVCLLLTNTAACTVTIHGTAQAGFNISARSKAAKQDLFAAAGDGSILNFDSHTKTAGENALVTLSVQSNAGNAPVVDLDGRTAA